MTLAAEDELPDAVERRRMRVAIAEALNQYRLLRLRSGCDCPMDRIGGDVSASPIRRAFGRCLHEVRIDRSRGSPVKFP